MPTHIKHGSYSEGVSIQLLSHVRLFATPWTAACQASLSFTISQSLLKLTSIESVMPSGHLILGRAHLLLPSIFPGTGESAVKSEETETIPWQLRLPDQAVLVTVRLVCIFFQPWSLWRLLFLYLIPNPII